MAQYMNPLYELLKKDIEWQWLLKHEEAFQTLKEIIGNSSALVPFDPKKKIILQCDASKNGLGRCMFQEHGEVFKLVACASRTMNDHEVNYSQTEKELSSIYFSTQKFHAFIYNAIVDVQTDHKSVVSIMKKPICRIGSVQLQRFRLKLLKYLLNVCYVLGRNLHFTDMLSRSSLKSKTCNYDLFEMMHPTTKHLPMPDQ
ncbi:hypothetical protein ILUMI_08958 [Ignelater luminosus]|uniref:Reverse transcriptase/retrotransposon-derived protein RNase H-like domain-containing protein n=1 Tax=Ignelater luminosus TaxID=2038154 RepID=A0A8K0D597_IGNLU|nr:hypothetical protein ILUMI_08958 [Ignelater luminosus]